MLNIKWMASRTSALVRERESPYSLAARRVAHENHVPLEQMDGVVTKICRECGRRGGLVRARNVLRAKEGQKMRKTLLSEIAQEQEEKRVCEELLSSGRAWRDPDGNLHLLEESED